MGENDEPHAERRIELRRHAKRRNERRREFGRELAQIFGARLREARVACGFTQEHAAELIDISCEFYCRMERGKALPSVPTFGRIVVCLNVSPGLLLARGEESHELARLLNKVDGNPELLRMAIETIEQWDAPQSGPDGAPDKSTGDRAGT